MSKTRRNASVLKPISRLATERGRRVQQLRKLKGWNQKELGQRVKSSKMMIWRIENGLIENSSLFSKLAKQFGITTDYLLSGKENFNITITQGLYQKEVNCDSDHPLLANYIPLIKLEEAGIKIKKKEDIDAINDYELISVNPKLNSNSFAIQWSGDSMASSSINGPDFREGYILVFDPDKKPKENDFVIAYKRGWPSSIFRQLIIDCGEYYLKPLNPIYPLLKIDNTAIIFAVLVMFKGYLP